MVEAALGLPAGARVVDVGTGSGAIALALKHERPDLEVFGTDIADARRRAGERRAAGPRRDVHRRATCWPGVEADAVVSNPPYVVEGEALMPEVARFEPPLALFAGRWARRASGGCGVAPFVARRARRGPGRRGRRARARARATPSSGSATWRASREWWSGGDDARALGACVAARRRGRVPGGHGLRARVRPGERRTRSRGSTSSRAARRTSRRRSCSSTWTWPAVGPRTRALMERLLPGGVTLLLPNPARPVPAGLRARSRRRSACACRSWRRSAGRSAVVARTSSGGPDARRLDDVPEAIRAGADLVIDGGELPGTPSTVSTCASTRRAAGRSCGWARSPRA